MANDEKMCAVRMRAIIDRHGAALRDFLDRTPLDEVSALLATYRAQTKSDNASEALAGFFAVHGLAVALLSKWEGE